MTLPNAFPDTRKKIQVFVLLFTIGLCLWMMLKILDSENTNLEKINLLKKENISLESKKKVDSTSAIIANKILINRYKASTFLTLGNDTILINNNVEIIKNDDEILNMLIAKANLFSENSRIIKFNSKTIRFLEKKTENGQELNLYIIILMCVALIFLVFLGISYGDDDKIQNDLIRAQLLEKKKHLKVYCQSCGRNFNSIILKGKNHDGTESDDFCNDCFSFGSFNEPDLTLDLLQERYFNDLTFKYGNKRKDIILKRLKSLDRWTPNQF